MKHHSNPISEDWERIALDFQSTAHDFPPGDEKKAAEQKAQKIRKAAEIKNLLIWPELQPPR
ncbi:hypothetical protein [Bradyrhizobium cytisi]|uniref:Uncharacterized protein n=1 Tax=Bradyrhizobium cytisi TaxID=515489 RepID=A0A5S4WKS7_9BRAD|nr:hypothetical protein [Bradyrhizobium cytisi]TYL80844.1 hypothetical protein FXB38_23715 [Bradyrhizobium cytisi]